MLNFKLLQHDNKLVFFYLKEHQKNVPLIIQHYQLLLVLIVTFWFKTIFNKKKIIIDSFGFYDNFIRF